jgi:hypothetical protein
MSETSVVEQLQHAREGETRRLVLPLPRVPLRHIRTHSEGTGA